MKELTIEEKAKAYDEAIERAKEWSETKNGYYTPKELCEEIFPELKESEDERIRKAILELVKQSSEILDTQNQSNMIAWLEKQKWKPSDVQIKALKIVKDYVVSNNWNDYICNALENLLGQLKKL